MMGAHVLEKGLTPLPLDTVGFWSTYGKETVQGIWGPWQISILPSSPFLCRCSGSAGTVFSQTQRFADFLENFS